MELRTSYGRSRIELYARCCGLLLIAGHCATARAEDGLERGRPAMLPVLAKCGKLILNDDGSSDRGGKIVVGLGETAKLRAGAGLWERSAAGANVWRSTWMPGMGHIPVVSYRGFKADNLVVKVTFRYGEMSEPWHSQCFRIAADRRPEITGHLVSAWANPNHDFIETGFLLQHIRKTPHKKIIEDLLLDRQPLTVKPRDWNTAMLEIVDDEALFRMGDHVAYAQARQIRGPKNLVSLTLGQTWHEIKNVRIWRATRNAEWATKKVHILKSRKPFAPVVHDYKPN